MFVMKSATRASTNEVWGGHVYLGGIFWETVHVKVFSPITLGMTEGLKGGNTDTRQSKLEKSPDTYEIS